MIKRENSKEKFYSSIENSANPKYVNKKASAKCPSVLAKRTEPSYESFEIL